MIKIVGKGQKGGKEKFNCASASLRAIKTFNILTDQ